MIDNFVSAVIVAAGNSTRMGKDKIFLKLNSDPAISYTLMAFEKSNTINEIVIVCKDENKEKLKNIIKRYSISKFKDFAIGGSSRQESVFSGIKKCSNHSSYYAIHDAARCLITSNEIDQTVMDAFVYKASSLGVPCKDTLKIIDSNNFVINTPDRNCLWAIQTPQVFEKNLYLNAISLAIKNKKNYTDDCQLIENSGTPVHIIMGNYSNLKLTTPDDIIIFENILKLRNETLCE